MSMFVWNNAKVYTQLTNELFKNFWDLRVRLDLDQPLKATHEKFLQLWISTRLQKVEQWTGVNVK